MNMGNYIIKRILTGIFSLFVLITVTFFLTRSMPGSPFQSSNISLNMVETMEKEYGLDEPAAVQYKNYLTGLLRGDMGISYKKQGVRVSDVIARAWPYTVKVGGLAILTALVLGTALGICQACSRKTLVREGIFIGTVLGGAIPNFAAAVLLLLIFGVKLGWFPVSGLLSRAHYLLPVLSLALYPTTVVARMMNQSIREESAKEYVVMAKARGISQKKILYCHILRHAWTSILGYLGPAAAYLITGSFVTETVFNIPGLGREFVNAVSGRDYTMIMGLTIFMGMVVIIVNLAMDILRMILEPSVRRSK